ncbi:MAG: hypothetical protein CM1200mP10_23050 [Candidatus Neomarinimicrobiota bacterium]|nr:MAG: hypothetical protein CM1200mP10_23050 [Candidatus Neomarinimicrobiota bacterium]
MLGRRSFIIVSGLGLGDFKKWLLNLLKKGKNFHWFGVYCLLLGIIALAFEMNIVGIIFILYMVFLIGVGYKTMKFNKSREDYLLAGRKLGPWVTAFSRGLPANQRGYCWPCLGSNFCRFR